MKTAELIARLSEDTEIGPQIGARLVTALVTGMAVSALIMLAWIGPRPDLEAALGTAMFWMKLGYATALALLAFPIVRALSRPDGTLGRAALWLLAPVGIFAQIAMYRLATAAPGASHHLIMGNSSDVCPWRIVGLSLPVLAALILGLRRLAPTRLAMAGVAAGFLAGAAGMFVYAFHCDETAAPFVVIWYTLGMVITGALGGLLGRAALRW